METGLLVNLKSYAVAERVAEISLVSGIVDDVARYLVHVGVLCALGYRVDCGKLSFENGVVELLHVLVSLAYNDGSGHVGVVSVNHSAVVHCEEAAFKSYVSRNAVGS